MKFIQGDNRNQIDLFPVSLEQSIDPDNEVRIIDLFVESRSIKDYGFCYILTKKGISRANFDVGFMFIAYNLRRIGNILTREVLKEYLRIPVFSIPGIFDLSGLFIMSFGRQFPEKCKSVENYRWLKWA